MKHLIILSILLVLVACTPEGNGEGGDATQVPPITTGVELPQAITSVDVAGGEIVVNYPAEWTAQEFGGSVALGNNEVLFADTANNISSGEVIGSILVVSGDMLAALEMGENPTVNEVLANFVQQTTGEDPDASFDLDEPQPFTINGRDAVVQYGTATDSSGTSDVAFAMVDVGGGFALMSFVASQDEITQYDNIIRAIAGDVEYTITEAEG